MKRDFSIVTTRSLFVTTLLILFFSSVCATIAQARTWTDKTGRQMQAEFVRISGRQVVLKRNGKILKINLTTLSEEDRDWLEVQKINEDDRGWIDANGKEFFGKFIRMDGNNVVISTNGAEVSVPWKKVSSEDKEILRKLVKVLQSDVVLPKDESTTSFTIGLRSKIKKPSATPTISSMETVIKKPSSPRVSPNKLHKVTTWTNLNGKRIQAKFVRTENDRVVLNVHGKEHILPIAKLSFADQSRIKQITGSSNIGLATARGRSRDSLDISKNAIDDEETSEDESSKEGLTGVTDSGNDAQKEWLASIETANKRRDKERREWLEKVRESSAKNQVRTGSSREAIAAAKEKANELRRKVRERSEAAAEEAGESEPNLFGEDIDVNSNRNPNYQNQTPQQMEIIEYECSSCKHRFLKKPKVGSKCPNPKCRVRFDYIEGEGSSFNFSGRRWRGIIKLVVIAVIAIGGFCVKSFAS